MLSCESDMLLDLFFPEPEVSEEKVEMTEEEAFKYLTETVGGEDEDPFKNAGEDCVRKLTFSRSAGCVDFGGDG